MTAQPRSRTPEPGDGPADPPGSVDSSGSWGDDLPEQMRVRLDKRERLGAGGGAGTGGAGGAAGGPPLPGPPPAPPPVGQGPAGGPTPGPGPPPPPRGT